MSKAYRHPMDRRTFLKLGSLGAAMAATGRGLAADSAAPVYRTLGRTGMKVSTIGFGAMKTAEPGVFHAAFDRGVNYVDTARVYLEGRNEGIVGQALKGYRDKVFVATKVMGKPRAEMESLIAESFAALKLDYVDLLQLHRIKSKEEVYNPEYRSVFIEARKQGKTRWIGVTTHENEAEVINAVVDDPEKLYDTVLVTYNFKSDPKVTAAIARAAQAGVGIIAMKTQAGGYKTGEFGEIAPHQAALRWVLRDPNVACAIPGMVDLQQVMENTAVMGMPLTQADLDDLSRYAAAIAPYYCHRCGQCRETCPARVAIPDVHRSLLYAEGGYQDLDLARAAYAEIPASNSAAACRDCTRCAARCPNGLNIGERMNRARAWLA